MDDSWWPGNLAAVTGTALHRFTGGDWTLLIILILALLLAATSAAAETALTSVSRIKIRNMAAEGDIPASRVQRILQQPQIFLSTILVMSNVAIIVATTVSTILAINLFASYGDVISTIALSLVVLIFCEITPKTMAVQAPERWARALVAPVEWLSRILRPLVLALIAITSGLVRVFGGQQIRRGPFVTEEELRMLVEVGEQEGVLEEEEREMIHNVFELADTAVREVMVPRIDMVTVEATATIQEAVDLIVRGGKSRIPVYDESPENIIGVLYAKDLLKIIANPQRPQSVKSMVRSAYFVPESKRADDLLRELQQKRVHMAIVVDEYGAVAGLVTIEDLVEEIIGDIQDEYDREEQIFERISEDEYVIDPKISIDDFNELMDTTLISENYDTLGGFVYAQLDKIPTPGDVVTYDGLSIAVLSTKGRRLTRVRVVRTHGAPTAGDIQDTASHGDMAEIRNGTAPEAERNDNDDHEDHEGTPPVEGRDAQHSEPDRDIVIYPEQPEQSVGQTAEGADSQQTVFRTGDASRHLRRHGGPSRRGYHGTQDSHRHL